MLRIPTIKTTKHGFYSASSSLAYGPYSLTSASFRMTAHTDLSSALFLHLLTSVDFRSFSVESNHLNFGLPAFLLPCGFLRNTYVTVLSSDMVFIILIKKKLF
jgi:hypothetical protein